MSSAGKLQLLQVSLEGIPTYFLSLFKMPKYLTDKLEQIQRTFLWTRVEEKKRMSLVKWEKVCLPKTHGGLNIRNIQNMNKALLSKINWNLISNNKDWGENMKAKYLQGSVNYNFLHQEGLPKGLVIWNKMIKSRSLIKKGLK